MKKIVWIFGIIVILILIIISFVFLAQENCAESEDIPSCCRDWANRNDMMIPECIGQWEIVNGMCYWNCDTEPIVGGCAGVSLEYRQECCNNWAEENNILHIMCEGYWEIINNKCSWKCSECPEHWYVNKMPGINNSNDEYFIINKERKEINEVDINWIKENCDIEKEIVY